MFFLFPSQGRPLICFVSPGELRAAYLPNSTTAPPPASEAAFYTVKDNDADLNEAESDDELDNNVKKVDVNGMYTTTYQHREGDTYTTAPSTAPTVQLEGAVKAWFDARSSDASLKIDPAAVKFEKQPNLGAGQFGTVLAAKMKRDGKDVRVAVKMLKSTAHAGSDADKVAFKAAQLEFLGEIKIMRRVAKKNPEHCTKLLGVYSSNGALHAVLDFALVGSLDKFLREDQKTASTKLTEKDKCNILYQVARGLVEVHSVNVLHLDLAGRNCLAYFSPTEMEKGLQIKICDFGLALKVPKGQPGVQLTPRCKPARTSPPEVLRNYATFKSDVYMFGCLIWEVLTDTDPHPNVPGHLNALTKLANDVRDGKAPITPPPPVVSAGLGDLLKRCVNVGGGIPTVTTDNMRNCIANRPTAKQVVQALERFKSV
jgi:serine/threonine protein kinase